MSASCASQHSNRVEPRSASRSLLLAFVALAAAPCVGRTAPTCGCSPKSMPIVALASLWNLLAGYAGLVSVGQQAYVGLGGYLLFALAMLAGVPPAARRSRSPASSRRSSPSRSRR